MSEHLQSLTAATTSITLVGEETLPIIPASSDSSLTINNNNNTSSSSSLTNSTLNTNDNNNNTSSSSSMNVFNPQQSIQFKKSIIEIPPPKENQCNYLVKQKKRFCKREKAPHSNYCHTHLQENTTTTNNNDSTNIDCNNSNIIDSNKKRVRCPIDPNHTVYENRLAKHIKICNKSIEQVKMTSQPYFNKNLHYNYLFNMFSDHNSDHNVETKTYSSIGDVFKNNSEYFYKLIDKINNLYSKLNIDTFIESKINENYNFITSTDEEFSEKHHKQHCSFIYNLNELQCLSNHLNYIEFGCGKGNLSYCVRRALIDEQLNTTSHVNTSSDNTIDNTIDNTSSDVNTTSHVSTKRQQTFILIDRENQRRKVDNFIKYGKKIQNNQQDHKVSQCNVERILADIGDLDLSKINSIVHRNDTSNNSNNTTNNSNNENTISISKHLCGIATDLTLICLKDLNDKLPNINKGIFIALCCHHKCTFNGYINKEFLLKNEITENDFSIIKLLTSFATCQFSKLQNKNTSEEYGLNDKEKEEIGLKCKRILDYGRLDYLKKTNQYNYLKLIYYCNRDTSLENCMLIALNK